MLTAICMVLHATVRYRSHRRAAAVPFDGPKYVVGVAKEGHVPTQQPRGIVQPSRIPSLSILAQRRVSGRCCSRQGSSACAGLLFL